MKYGTTLLAVLISIGGIISMLPVTPEKLIGAGIVILFIVGLAFRHDIKVYEDKHKEVS